MVFGPIRKVARAARGKKDNADKTFLEDTKTDLTEFFVLKGMTPANAMKASGETIQRYRDKLGEVGI